MCNQWISVAERLPERDETLPSSTPWSAEVLVVVQAGAVQFVVLANYNYDDNGWWYSDDTNMSVEDLGTVTHWMVPPAFPPFVQHVTREENAHAGN